MIIREKDTHEGRFLTVEHEEQNIGLDMKLIESLDNRYILRPVPGRSGDGILCYNVSSCESFGNYLVNRRMDRTELVGFLAQMKSVIRALEDHMLTDANILFDPEHVYIDRGTRKVRFVPVCRQDGTFAQRLRPLLEMIFCHADLEDTDSLRLAAKMMRTILEGDLKMHTLMELAEAGMPAGNRERRSRILEEDRMQAEPLDSEEEVTVLLADLNRGEPADISSPEPIAKEETAGSSKGFFYSLAARFKEDDEDDEDE